MSTPLRPDIFEPLRSLNSQENDPDPSLGGILGTVLSIVIVTGLVALLFTGCTIFRNPQTGIVVTCNSYSAALTTLATFRATGRLSNDQIRSVEDIRVVINPICEAVPLEGSYSTLDLVEDLTFRLLQIRDNSNITYLPPPPSEAPFNLYPPAHRYTAETMEIPL